jgi:N-acetylglutamate synthase-like GNAT family acetyltransferase
LPSAVALLNDALGSGFVRVEDIQELCSSAEGIVLVAMDDSGKLEGVGTAVVMEESAKENLEQKLIVAGARRPNIVGTKVGLLQSAAVVPKSRGKGIGLRLVKERLSHLKEAGCLTAVVLAWDSGSVNSSIGVLEAAGFQRVAGIPEYWREPEGQETFDCITCGRPCVCTAIVMRRSLYDFPY